MSIKGVAVVSVELLFEIGLLKGTFEKYWSLTVEIYKKLIFLTGDTLSMSNFCVFIKSLQHKSSHVFEKTHEKGLKLRKSLNKVVPVVGYWYFGLSMLVNICKLFSGHFI